MKKVSKLIASVLLGVSVVAFSPVVEAHAEWRQDNHGWWYAEGNSYSRGWKNIGGSWYYFDGSGYMKTGWIQDGGNWYYLKADGTMATSNTVIDGQISAFYPDGRWKNYVTTTSNSATNNATSVQTNTNYFTFERAKEIVEKSINVDDSWFGGSNRKIEITKGGYNGLPVEDKVYTKNLCIDGVFKDVKYRLVGVIDKYTGEYYGIYRVFEIGDPEEHPRGTEYMDSVMYDYDGVKINTRTFDKNGVWTSTWTKEEGDRLAGLWGVSNNTNSNSSEMDKMTNPDYRKNHQEEYNKMISGK